MVIKCNILMYVFILIFRYQFTVLAHFYENHNNTEHPNALHHDSMLVLNDAS